MRFESILPLSSALALGASAAAIVPRQDETETIVAGFTAYGARCGGIGLSFPISVTLPEANQCNPMPLGNAYGSLLLLEIRESNPSCKFTAFSDAACAPGTGVELVPRVCVDAPGAGSWRAYTVECS